VAALTQTGLPLEGRPPPASWSNPDAVYTPPHLATFLVDLLPWDGVRRVLEPSVGGGAWVDALSDRLELARDLEGIPGRRGLSPGLEVVGVDVDPHCRGAELELEGYRFEFGDVRFLEELGTFDRAIGNPPYSAIREHVERALELSVEVAFLLPLDLLGGGEEIPRWLGRTPLRRYWPLRQRPWPKKLRGTAFFWWDRRLPPLDERLDEPIGYPPLDWKTR
jgi:hypothetical protein